MTLYIGNSHNRKSYIENEFVNKYNNTLFLTWNNYTLCNCIYPSWNNILYLNSKINSLCEHLVIDELPPIFTKYENDLITIILNNLCKIYKVHLFIPYHMKGLNEFKTIKYV